MRRSNKIIPILLAGLLCAGHAAAQDDITPEPKDESEGGLREAVVNVGSQPARDLGMSKRQVPAILQQAAAAPYDVQGLESCEAVAAQRAALDDVLGPDLDGSEPVRENRGVKLAEAGGRTLVNSIIPFRGLIREISGAAPADRRLELMVDAGHARRGFLRGVEAKLECAIPVIDLASTPPATVVGALNE
ncbi:MAG: hypothetical protein ABW063_00890 [Caulobacter sp.]